MKIPQIRESDNFAAGKFRELVDRLVSYSQQGILADPQKFVKISCAGKFPVLQYASLTAVHLIFRFTI